MFALTGFQRDLLYTIAGLDRPSGQQVRERISKSVGEVNHGRLYPNLNTLVEKQFVEKGQKNSRTNYYRLTSKGKGAIIKRRQWEEEMVPFLDSGQ
jgi:DNA-binding PadR family transcriptional regulator